MHLCYDVNEKWAGGFMSRDNANANKGYLRHYANYLFLDFIIKNSKNTIEKIQATKEIVICERKMKWWENLPLFDRAYVNDEMKKLRKDWDKNIA